jgi:hypothetical protein
MEVQKGLRDFSRLVFLLILCVLLQLTLYVAHTSDQVVYGPFEVIYEPFFFFFCSYFLALFLQFGYVVGNRIPLVFCSNIIPFSHID